MDVRTKPSRRGPGALDIWIDGEFRGAVLPHHRGGWRVITRTGKYADQQFAGIDQAANWLYLNR